jgi:hypothetical protein
MLLFLSVIASPMKVFGGAVYSVAPSLQMESCAVSQPQRLEISFLGTRIRAEGIAGILGAILIIGVILTAYLS